MVSFIQLLSIIQSSSTIAIWLLVLFIDKFLFSDRELLFNIIVSEQRPELIVVVDALDCKRKPGEIFLASIEEIPENKINDFSLHLMPTLNMLKELRDLCNVEVVIVAAQPKNIPEEPEGGLSKEIKGAVEEAASYISENYFNQKDK